MKKLLIIIELFLFVFLTSLSAQVVDYFPNRNENYGYMWWLNTNGKRHWEGLSENIYYAAGFGGNFIIIDKDNGLVVVTRWLDPLKIKEFMQKVNQVL